MRVVDTQIEVARYFDVVQPTVAIWKRKGMPKTADGKYDLDEIQALRMKNLKYGKKGQTLEERRDFEI